MISEVLTNDDKINVSMHSVSKRVCVCVCVSPSESSLCCFCPTYVWMQQTCI